MSLSLILPVTLTALTGKSPTSGGRLAADPGLERWSGVVSGGVGLGGLGDGDVEAECLDLADVVAELAAGVGAGLVVVVAEVGEPGLGVAEQVPDDDQDGACDSDLRLGLAAAAGYPGVPLS